MPENEFVIGRRQFLAGGIAAVAAVATAPASAATGKTGRSKRRPVASGAVIASAPVLQNAAETTIGVSFAVSSDASGWVEYSTSKSMDGARRVYSGGAGLMDVNGKVALVRLKGLSPATKYYYRIGADRIEYGGGYKIKNLGSEVAGKIHSFTTLGSGARGSFCVINDTHEKKPALDAVFRKLRELKPSVVVWNGDASNVTETIDDAIGVFLRPHPGHPEYASDTPYMFINGNHDFRGRFNRHLGDLMMFREPTERAPEFAELGRNFVQRLGDVALIGLDTGEDKLDTNPKSAGIFRMREYRELQTRWLAEAVKSDAVASARHKVAFCHIPLFDPRLDENPGDVAPDDSDPLYKHPWACWQRTCAKMWGPILERAGVRLLVTAHQHAYRRDNPGKGHPWMQLVGGGPDVNSGKTFPTVIEGRVEGERLVVTVHDARSGRIIDKISV